MKIIVFVENIQCGGVDTFCENLINYWPNQGDDFLFICNDSHPGVPYVKNNINRQCEFYIHTIPISWSILKKSSHIFPYRFLKFLAPLVRIALLPIQFLRIYKIFHRNQGGALLSVSGGYPGGETCRLASIIWGHMGRKRNVYNFHNLAQPPRFGLGWYEGIMDKFLSKHVDLFIGVSKICSDSLRVRRSFLKLNNIKHIYNGVKIINNREKSLDIYTKFGIPVNAQVCLMLATYEERKGHDFIFKAFKLASESVRDLHLIVCGGGDKEEIRRVEDLKDQITPNCNIHLTGFVPNGGQLIKQSKILLIGSQSLESFGLTAVEAMQLGIPVVSTNIGGLPEVIGIDGKCGLLTEKNDVKGFADNIVELCQNELLYADVSRHAKIRAMEKFTPEQMASQYMNEIRHLEC